MKNKSVFGGVALALLPLSGQAGYLDVTTADVAAGKLAFTEERMISAETILADDKGGFDLLDVKLRGDSSELEAAQISVSPLGQVVVRDATLSAIDTGKGLAEFGYAKFSKADILDLMMQGDSCSPLPVQDRTISDRGTIDLMDVVLHAPTDPLTAHDVDYTPEDMSFGTLHLAIEGTDECFMANEFKMTKWRLSAADGGVSTVSKGSGIFSLLPGMEAQYAVNLHMEDMNTFNSDGEVILQSSESRLDMAMDAALVDFILETPDMASADVVPGLVKKLSETGLEASYQNLGLYVPAARVLGDTVKAAPATIEGDVSFLLSSPADAIKLKTDVHLEGLVDQTFNMDMTIDPEGAGGAAFGMMTSHPLGALLPYLKLNSVQYDVQDKGLWSWFEAEAGRTPADYLQQYSGYLSMAPDEISEPVLGWLTVLAEEGKAKLKVKPEAPVSFMDVAMASMMNPGALGSMLGVSAE